jgi:CBS domain-containing protein
VAERLREVERQIAALLRERERHLAEVLRERGEALREALERAEVSPRPAPPRRRRSAVRLVVNRYTIGFGVGYVLGARAGRERYEQIVQRWRSFTGNPTVQRIEARGREAAVRAGRGAAEAVRARFRPSRSVREVMTPVPRTVRSTATLVEAARSMREADAGAVIVVDDRDRVVGIVTDRDIAVRAVAEGRDPATTMVAQVASTDLTTLSPTDTVSHAVRLMRERAIRRLPVVEGGRPVGIVSIGDLAVARDRDSALAEISAAPPNR